VKLAAPQRASRWWLRGCLEVWDSACPCCKRPIQAQLCKPWDTSPLAPSVKGKYAYVITLWGSAPDYILGAMVLGHSLKRSGSRHALVCLHTRDVAPASLRLLSHHWNCRLIEHVPACLDKLSFQQPNQEHRFDKVFTKLRALSLTEYEKVLVMDIDLVVRSNIDELFELPAPAALRRGMNEWKLRTGDPIDGRAFFGGKDSSPQWSWGQGTGINAGVMLLSPSSHALEQMLEEISEPNHPSHARGNGPEQDYLSRYWADAPWTYIGVEFNYQLHQMFFALHPKWASYSDRTALLRRSQDIKVVHFSGEPAAKPWHRILNSKLAEYWPDRSRDAEYTERFAEEFQGHWLWVKKDCASWEYAANGGRSEMRDLYLDRGEIYKRPWDGSAPKRIDIPEDITQGALAFLRRTLDFWFDCFQELEGELKLDLRQALLSGARPARAPPVVQSLPSADRADGADAEDTEVVVPFEWKRERGWWVEHSAEAFEKIVVTCSSVDGRAFVSFCEGGIETFGERELGLSGAFMKVAGPHCARHFALAPRVPWAPGGGDGAGEAGVGAGQDPQRRAEADAAAIQLWVETVPVGAAVLVAVVGLDGATLSLVLEALSALGLPSEPPPSSHYSLAAIGIRRDPHRSRGSDWVTVGTESPRRMTADGDTWHACHASRDIAYASLPLKMVRH